MVVEPVEYGSEVRSCCAMWYSYGVRRVFGIEGVGLVAGLGGRANYPME